MSHSTPPTDPVPPGPPDSPDVPVRLNHERQRELLGGLLQAVAQRVHDEETLSEDHSGASESEDSGYMAACVALDQKREDARATVIRQYDMVRDESLSRIEAEISSIQIETERWEIG